MTIKLVVTETQNWMREGAHTQTWLLCVPQTKAIINSFRD
jgi:hypothetical protein